MGYGSYSASDWSKLKASRNLSSNQDVKEVFQNRKCDPKFDPLFIGTRECFDSQEHPNTTPIVIGLDVTASMGYLAVEVATKALNELIMKLYSTAAVEDPALMCAAYGDYLDTSPLQVSQFESDIRIAEQLLNLYFENGGCGLVVPTCLWAFLSRHTNIDAVNKRKQKGFLFTIGDGAEIRADNVRETIKKVIGDDIASASLSSILSELQEKFYVFHIMIGRDGNPNILHGYKIVINESDISVIPDIILGAIQLQKGKNLEKIIAQSEEIVAPVLKNALSQLSLVDTGNAIKL